MTLLSLLKATDEPGNTLLWRKIWTNPLLCELGKKYSRLETRHYIIDVLAADKDDLNTGIDSWGVYVCRLATLNCSRIIGRNSKQEHKIIIGDSYG